MLYWPLLSVGLTLLFITELCHSQAPGKSLIRNALLKRLHSLVNILTPLFHLAAFSF